jgi:hypothetical protein
MLRRLLGITELDRERDRSFWDKLCVCAEHCSVNRTATQKWLQHFHRMDTNWIPKQALQYRLKGKRHIGRLRIRCREQLHFQGLGAGTTLHPSELMIYSQLQVFFGHQFSFILYIPQILRYFISITYIRYGIKALFR